MNCRKCQHSEMKIIEKIFKNGTKHLEQRCASCGAHNGYKAQEIDPTKAGDVVFTYGKHKGKKICEVAKQDPSFLAYCFSNYPRNHYIKRALDLF